MGRMSKIELRARDDLMRIFGADVKHHPRISHCVFNADSYHRPDFYLPKFDLFIEVKGHMTFFAVNKMQYLFKLLKGRFYILQMTEESWISGSRKSEKTSESSAVKELNYKQQLDELSGLNNGCGDIDNAVAVLSKISQTRLKRYIRLRMKDKSTWEKQYKIQFGGKLSHSPSAELMRKK